MAILGATGCGKTSLVNLIPRFYECHEGSVLVDGVDVKDCIIRSMIEETAYKILSDIYKVNSREWVYSQSAPVEVEMTITNWELLEKQTEIGVEYRLRFEVA